MNPRDFNSYSSFYVQPFKWEEDVERAFDNKSQVTHCWAMAIPANEDGEPLAKETTTTCLFRIKNYPYRVTLIVATEGVTEGEIRNIRAYLQDWVTTYHGMVCIDRDGYNSMKGKKRDEIENYFQQMYAAEYSPKMISYEKRRRVYYYKRSSETPNQSNSSIKYPEKESWVINVDFVNKTAFQKFSGTMSGCYMSGEYINGKRVKSLTKQIMGKTYTFEIGFKGIDSVQKLLTERRVPRCGWFFVRDVEMVKPAQRVCSNGASKTWVTESGSKMAIDNYTPEFFVESVSILPAKPSIARGLLSVPSTVSWDIECYSDNHKALPVPWNPHHAAYIITAVYQQYKRPETRIRKAFVFGKCDYETPTEKDNQTSALVRCDTELEMIDRFSEFVQDVNPEILIGYNIFGFDINYLTIRMQRSLRKWNNMGRLKENITQTSFIDWSSSAYGKNQLYWIEAPGRICVDMMKIIERDYKYSDYKLETVSQALLGKGKNDVSPQEMFRIYELCLNNEPGCEQEMLKVVLYGIQDAVLPIELFEKINGWPFLIESSNVMCVNPMELFTRGQQLRLLNQFYDKCFHMGFVIDSRSVNVIEAEGAYVVDPIKGLHENVLTLDFASLYPSIMIAHNIGQDTYVLPDDPIPDEHCHVFEWTDDEEKKLNEQGCFEGDAEALDNMLSKWVVDEDVDDEGRPKYKIQKTAEGKWRFRFIKEEYGHRSIVATMLVDLLAARKAVRNEQKKVKDSDPIYYDVLEQRQKAIKVSCNSAYGMLLAQESGKLALAEGGVCVTFRGRQLNLEMQRLARERYGAQTIYGDTDSIMVKSAYTKLMVEAARKFETEKPSIEEIDSLAVELGIKDYSHEIAMRFLDHYHGFKEEHEVCNEMGDHIARDISSHLPKPISLEFENVFVKALFMMKKRYACIVLDRDKMVVKAHPNKMYTKGIMLARRDNCQWARDLFRDALFNLLIGKTRQEVALIVNDHIQRLLTWQVPMESLQIIQKLGFDYKSDTFPLKLFSEHLQDIGKPAKPNDRIPFIVSSCPSRLANPEDPKLGHYYRLIETLREEIFRGENSIDYLYYIERLTNDVNQIFSIGYIPEIQKSNAVREARRFKEIDSELDKVEGSIRTLQTVCETMETKLGNLPEKSKESVQIRKELRVEKKRLSDVNKERDKILKQRTLLENKGLEKFDKKRNTNDLFLDDTFYTHIVDMLALRKRIMKQVVTKEWVLKSRMLQEKQPMTKKSPQRRIEDFFMNNK